MNKFIDKNLNNVILHVLKWIKKKKNKKVENTEFNVVQKLKQKHVILSV